MTTLPVTPPGAEAATPAERLSHGIAVVRRRWLLAGAVILLAAATGYGLAAHQPKRYAARAQVVIGAGDQVEGVALGGPNSGAQTDLERQANTDLALVKLRKIAAEVRHQLHLRRSARALLSQVTASYVGNSNIVGITAEDKNPTRAAAIANAFATAYQAYRRDDELAKLRAALASARIRLLNLGPSGIDTPFGHLLQESINRLQVAALLDPGTVTVAQYASVPKSNANRRPTEVAIIGLFVGCVLAALILALLERLDDRLHDEQAVTRAFGRAPLARLVLGRSTRALVDEQRDLARLAARILGTRGERSVLLVGSPGERPGSTRVALGLAAALSHVGKTVIAIDARTRPSRKDDDEAGGQTGLAGILNGYTVLERELRPLSTARGFGGSTVAILPSGRLVEGGELVAAGEVLRYVVQQAARRADLVVIAGPPLLRGAEPVSLLPVVDAVLVVAEIGQTTGAEAAETLALLAETGADVLGVVATRRGLGARSAGFPTPTPNAAGAAATDGDELPVEGKPPLPLP